MIHHSRPQPGFTVPSSISEPVPLRESAPRPWLPPPPQLVWSGRPAGTIHFLVHEALPELRAYAEAQGWLLRGWTDLQVPWIELRYTTDGWATTHVLRSTDVPCPVVNGWFYLPQVTRGDEVEFAVRVGLACRAEEDSAGERAQGELWLNDGGKNYRQRAK